MTSGILLTPMNEHVWNIFLYFKLHHTKQDSMHISLYQSTECITPFDFFFWPVKCIKTKKIDIKLHLFSSLVTTISLSGTILNRNSVKKFFKVTPSFKNISISLILSFNFRTQKVSQKMNFCSRWYQIMKLWLLNWKINVILYQISLF